MGSPVSKERTSCTRASWTAGERLQRMKEWEPSSRERCPTSSVEPEEHWYLYSTTRSRNLSCDQLMLMHISLGHSNVRHIANKVVIFGSNQIFHTGVYFFQ